MVTPLDRDPSAVRDASRHATGRRGSPRTCATTGWRVSENTVATMMAELGLQARRRRRRKQTTRQGRGRWRAPDLIGRDFPADGLNRKWYGDGTEIPTDEGKLLPGQRVGHGLAADRRVRPRRASRRRTWPTRALQMAVAVRGGREVDRPGCCCTPTRAASTPPGRSGPPAPGSASPSPWAGSASALDNAVIESWHSTLEFELRDLEHFTTKAQARARIPAWIEEYNHDRRHSVDRA